MKKLLCLATKPSLTIAPYLLQSIALLAARLWIANVFLKAGLLKLKDWEGTLALFDFEYSLPIIPYELAAYLGTAGELILPSLLIIGLFTPVAALGLFVMSLVIETLVYPNTTEHYYWMLLTAIIFTQGSGKFGLDYLLHKRINCTSA